MRPLLLLLLLAELLAGCRVAGPTRAARRAARQANGVSNKHILTESPTLERPAPAVGP